MRKASFSCRNAIQILFSTLRCVVTLFTLRQDKQKTDLHLSRWGKRWLEVRNIYYRWPVSGPGKRPVISLTYPGNRAPPTVNLFSLWKALALPLWLKSVLLIYLGLVRQSWVISVIDNFFPSSNSTISQVKPTEGAIGRNQALAMVKRRKQLCFLLSAQAEWWQVAHP